MNKALAALSILALSQAALAEGTSVAVRGTAPNPSGMPTLRETVVQYGDLNANDKQGAAALLGRINAAADVVCRPYRQTGSASLAAAVAQCHSRAVADAVTRVDSAELAAAAQ